MFLFNFRKITLNIIVLTLIFNACNSSEDLIMKRLIEIKKKAHMQVKDLKCHPPQQKNNFYSSQIDSDGYMKKKENEPIPQIELPINDSDSDGIFDHLDECPDSPIYAVVNKKGCWLPEMILFKKDRADIQAVDYDTLNKVISRLKNNPLFKVEIHGHTCNTHTNEYNKILSIRRAQSAKNYFILKGIASKRISIRGFANSKPIRSNTSEESRSKNRRVELYLRR